MRGSQVVSILSAFGAGVGVGYFLFKVQTEQDLQEEYRQSTASMRRALEAARIDAETPVATEEELEIDFNEVAYEGESPRKIMDASIHSVSIDDKPNVFGGTLEVKTEGENPYHTAVEATETPVQTFVAGGINDYGVSYIEEEEYEEEDGRFKGQITVDMMNFSEPAFFMDGVQINDWDTRLGDSILVDLGQHASTGVLYVRNHQTDEDYEVIVEKS